MSIHPKLWTLVLCSAAGGLFFVSLRHSRETRKFREQVAAVRTSIQQPNTPSSGEREVPLKMEPDAERNKALEENQVEAQRLQKEIEWLVAEIAAPPKPPKAKNENPVSGSNFTLNQILEAARLGNTHRLAEFLTFDPGDETEAETLFAQLSSEIQTEHASARHLMGSIAALILLPAKIGSMRVVSEPQLAENKSSITWQLGPQKSDVLPPPRPITCVLRPVSNGDWLLVVSPEMMASYREAVSEALKKTKS